MKGSTRVAGALALLLVLSCASAKPDTEDHSPSSSETSSTPATPSEPDSPETTSRPAAPVEEGATPSPENQAAALSEELGEEVGGVGDLLIAPTRLVLSERDRFAELTLVNIGDETATYRITFTELRMTEDGQLITIEDPEEPINPASPYLRYSPRQITLEPGLAQTIRLQVRRAADLPEGEYRSHLLVHGVPKPPSPVDEEAPQDEQQFQIRLVPIYGISIPIFLRQGSPSASASISDMQLAVENGAKVLRFHLNRDGSRSVYGDFRAVYTAPSGEETEVAMTKGVAVYTPLDHRQVTLRLNPETELSGGRITVTFRDAEQPGGAVLATEAIQVPR